MTEMKFPTSANDNPPSQSIAQEQATTQGGVFSVLSGLSGLTKNVLEKLGILVDMRHPDVILEELNAKRRTEQVLSPANDDTTIVGEEEKAA